MQRQQSGHSGHERPYRHAQLRCAVEKVRPQDPVKALWVLPLYRLYLCIVSPPQGVDGHSPIVPNAVVDAVALEVGKQIVLAVSEHHMR
jgi:hypothetical protein